MQIKETISNILKATGRKGIEELLEYMDANGFYSAPCSSKYHLCKPGGLAEHSLNVFEQAAAMIEAFYIKQDKPFSHELINSAAICSILHDIGKIGQYGKSVYIENEDPGIQPYNVNYELLYVPHEVRSIAIISKFIELTEEEQFAILYHNGLYGELKSIRGKETPLYMILHFADMWACRVVESEDEV